MLQLLLLQLISTIVNIIYMILWSIFSFIWPKKPSNIPPIKNPLLTLSATTLARKIRHREITSYEAVNTYIERIKEVNPFINAVVDERFTVALNEAKICDKELEDGTYDIETLEKEKPLYGVPLSVKECIAVKGLSNTGCNVVIARQGVKAASDGAIVELYRNAGGIPLCVTNTPEMCANIDTANLVYGRTVNPYDSRYSAAGSSGGEGALLTTCGSLIGTGSDLGGSIRLPGQFNGIFGLKPTPGVIPVDGLFPPSEDKKHEFNTVGPMTRYVEDLSLVMKVISSRCDRNLRLDTPVDLKRLNVFYQLSFDGVYGVQMPTEDIQRCILKGARHLEQCVAQVKKLPIEWPNNTFELLWRMFLDTDKPVPLLVDSKNSKCSKNPFIEMGKALFGKSVHTKTCIYFAMWQEFACPLDPSSPYKKQGEALRQKLIDLLRENGVLLLPTFTVPATFPHLMMLHFFNILHTFIFNVFGFPSLHVPIELNNEGVPIGFQVVAAPYQERLCLAVAKELETTFGGWKQPTCSS